MRTSRMTASAFALAFAFCVVAACSGGGGDDSSSSGNNNNPTPPLSGIQVYEGAGTAGPQVTNGAAAANGRDFGGQDIAAGPTAALTITIRNNGAGNLTLAMPVLTGATSQFSMGTGSYQTTVAPSATTSFTIVFDPTSAGVKDATVSIVNDGGNDVSPFAILVSGVGVNGGLPPITPDAAISGPASIPESDSGSSNATFTVTLSAATSLTVNVDYATANGTATAGTDYTQKSGTLTFAPGQTVRTVNIAILGDTDVETDETFDVNLSTPSNCVITTGTATGTITDDDTASATPTYAADIQPIFDSRCIGCHPSNGGLNLTSHANLMAGGNSGPVVVAGNATNSLIVKRIEGTIQPQMPKGGPPLSAVQIQKIKDWINAGALNN